MKERIINPLDGCLGKVSGWEEGDALADDARERLMDINEKDYFVTTRLVDGTHVNILVKIER